MMTLDQHEVEAKVKAFSYFAYPIFAENRWTFGRGYIPSHDDLKRVARELVVACANATTDRMEAFASSGHIFAVAGRNGVITLGIIPDLGGK